MAGLAGAHFADTWASSIRESWCFPSLLCCDGASLNTPPGAEVSGLGGGHAQGASPDEGEAGGTAARGQWVSEGEGYHGLRRRRTTGQACLLGGRSGRVICAGLCELRERAGEGSLILLRKVAGHRLFYLPSAFPIHPTRAVRRRPPHPPFHHPDLDSPSLVLRRSGHCEPSRS